MIGERAKDLGLVVENSPGVYEPTGEEFPKELIDFLIFYKLLIIICKLCIAKFDEGKILEEMKKIQVKYDAIFVKVDSARMKVETLAKVLPSFVEDNSLPEIIAPFEKSAKDLTEVRKKMVPEYAGTQYQIPSEVYTTKIHNKRAW